MAKTLHIPAQRTPPTAPAVEPGAQRGPVQVTPGPVAVEQGWGQVLRVITLEQHARMYDGHPEVRPGRPGT